MIVKEVFDINEVKAVLCHPEIYDTISSDNCPKAKDFEPPMVEEYEYIGGFVNGEIIALMVYHTYKDGKECHVQVLPEFRRDYAKEFGEQALLFRGTLPLYAEIPDLYKNVLDFALLNNFKVIDVRKSEYIKNGKTYNVNVLEYHDGIC